MTAIALNLAGGEAAEDVLPHLDYLWRGAPKIGSMSTEQPGGEGRVPAQATLPASPHMAAP